ncbi:MAG: glycosyltransferase family 4 protein [Bacteroidota bacterium]
MKVLYLTKYSRLGASSRMRSFQYFPYLEQQGMAVTVKPLFNDEYLHALYTGNRPSRFVLQAYLKRLITLFTVFSYDKVIIEKELFPYFPAFFEWLLTCLGLRYIVDYDDAIFHNYDQHPNQLIKGLLKNKIDSVMRYSRAVVAGNKYLAERAAKAGAKNVHIIPTVIDLDRYPTTKQHSPAQPVIIGWIGTRSTFEKHFAGIRPIIQKILQSYSVVFHVIGGTVDLGLGDRVKYLPWSEDKEVSAILDFDIGIMPLQNSLFEKGKCAYKLVQYMACGLPVIASPVGVNADIVHQDVNGYLANDEDDWLRAIGKYVNDVDLRSKHGLAGREMVEKSLCLQATRQDIYQIILNN